MGGERFLITRYQRRERRRTRRRTSENIGLGSLEVHFHGRIGSLKLAPVLRHCRILLHAHPRLRVVVSQTGMEALQNTLDITARVED